MKLIVGGSYQGKTAYLTGRLGVAPERIAAGEELAAAAETGRGGLPEGTEAVNRLHRYIRVRLEQGVAQETVEKEILSWTERIPELILVCDETGCGIVPMEAADRAYRECVGRICCALAGRADRVIRVCCGLGTVIRG